MNWLRRLRLERQRRPQQCSSISNKTKNTNKSHSISTSEKDVTNSDNLKKCDKKFRYHLNGIIEQFEFAKTSEQEMISASEQEKKTLIEKLEEAEKEMEGLRAQMTSLQNELAQANKQKNTCIVCQKECFRFCGMECFK